MLLGDELGLYKALAEAGPLSSAALAERTGTAQRYVREGGLHGSPRHLRPSYRCVTSVRARQLASSPRRGAGPPGTPSFGRR